MLDQLPKLLKHSRKNTKLLKGPVVQVFVITGITIVMAGDIAISISIGTIVKTF
jgi:hypothetical protein